MKKNWMLLLGLCALAALLPATAAPEAEQVDLNHTATGGYGYLIARDDRAALWWAEGAYKVLKDAPLPQRDQPVVQLSAARNEYESFVLVVTPQREMEQCRIALSDFVSAAGDTIAGSGTEIRRVEYVRVNPPTDYYGRKGDFPDPLPLYEGPVTLKAVENTPFWITVHVPSDAAAGEYTAQATVSGSGGWQQSVPVKLRVRNFTLPDTPTIRSGWGMNMDNVARYENLTTDEQKRQKFEKYMEMFARYKISPYDPFVYAPIREQVSGVAWQGGFFDSQEKVAGTYGYKVTDNSATERVEATTRELVPVTPGRAYRMEWQAKSQADQQTYVVGVECYNAERERVVFQNRFEQYSATPEWKAFELPLGTLDEEVRYLKVVLCSANRTLSGEDRGTMWFDELAIRPEGSQENILPAGSFEVNLDEIDIRLDFSDFERAARKYFAPPYNFNSFRLALKGLGSGTYYSRQNGRFEGFEQGTPEYEKLMQRYLQQIQSNLERIGVLGKEYIYWFDEPSEKDYDFVYQTNKMIKEYAPKLTTFLTEHVAGQDISEVTDISCTIWHQLNHDKIKRMNDRGLEYWSYLCVWPKAPWISEFIDHDAVNMRMWLWGSYVHRLSGILMWETTYWNSPEASPEGYLQNPWKDAMSWVTGYGWLYGKQTIWGNGDGRFFYPENRDPNGDRTTAYTGYPVPSIRLEILRAGIEDYEYLRLLERLAAEAGRKQAALKQEAEALLQIPKSIYTDEKTYNKDPQALLDYRERVADLIERFLQQ